MTTKDLLLGINYVDYGEDKVLIKGVTTKTLPLVEGLGGIFSDNNNAYIMRKQTISQLENNLKSIEKYMTIRHTQKSRRSSRLHRARSRSPSRLSPKTLKKSGGRRKPVKCKFEEESCSPSSPSSPKSEKMSLTTSSFVDPEMLLGESSDDSEYSDSSSDSDFPDASSPRDHAKELQEVLKRRKRRLQQRCI